MIEAIPFPASHDLPRESVDMPVVYEDEGQEEMGDSAQHSSTMAVLAFGIQAHLSGQPEYNVFWNLNLYYHPIERNAYVSPDVMVVAPFRPLGRISSYRIEGDGPAPLLAIEVLSPRTAQQGDLTDKPIIYAELGVPEYILVDENGLFLERRLVIRRLQSNGRWLESQDEDGGVTSALGFRAMFEADDRIRILNAATGRPYPRPDEAESEAGARRGAERAQKHAEREQRKEAQARLRAEAEKRTAEDGRLRAEAAMRLSDEARFKAEAEKRTAEDGRLRAEAEKRLAEEAKRLADERIREMEIELSRLRGERPPV